MPYLDYIHDCFTNHFTCSLFLFVPGHYFCLILNYWKNQKQIEIITTQNINNKIQLRNFKILLFDQIDLVFNPDQIVVIVLSNCLECDYEREVFLHLHFQVLMLFLTSSSKMIPRRKASEKWGTALVDCFCWSYSMLAEPRCFCCPSDYQWSCHLQSGACPGASCLYATLTFRNNNYQGLSGTSLFLAFRLRRRTSREMLTSERPGIVYEMGCDDLDPLRTWLFQACVPKGRCVLVFWHRYCVIAW